MTQNPPDDPDVNALNARVALLEALLAQREAQVIELAASNDKLSRQLDTLKNRLSGRKNERFTADMSQLTLFASDGDPTTPPPEAGEAPESPAQTAPEAATLPERRERGQNVKHHKHGRRKLPATLPRRPIHCAHPAGTCCPRCKGALRVIGTETTERLDWVPGHFEVLEITTDKAACPACPGAGVQTALGPTHAIPRALCANGLLARVLTDKFADHIPLHRQARRFAREGIDLSVSTICGWVLSAARMLDRLVDAMLQELRDGSWVQADDTGMPVQDGTDGKLRSARLWTYANGDHAVFRVTRTKEKEGPAAHLAGFTGRLLLDGGSEFNLIESAAGVVRAGCWSHARRYFFEARKESPIRAGEALILIRELFMLERSIATADLETRRQFRHEKSRPVLDRLKAWLQERVLDVRPSSALGEAVRYALNQWNRLTVFLHHPELPIHNNAAEFQLRQPVVGRKNWLFAGSEGGSEAAATLFSLVGSCILQAIDPWLYLNDVLDRLPDWPAKRVIELSPARWRAARLAELAGEAAAG